MYTKIKTLWGITQSKSRQQVTSQDVNTTGIAILNAKAHKQHVVEVAVVAHALDLPAHGRDVEHLGLVPAAEVRGRQELGLQALAR